MKTNTLLHLAACLLATGLLAACQKNAERRLVLRAGGDQFTVQVSGAVNIVQDASVNWSTTVFAEPGATLTFQACRRPSDLIQTPDTTYWTDTLNVALGISIFLDNAQLADASATTANGSATDACARLTYTVPER